MAPGQLDALLFGVTEAAVDGAGLETAWSMNIAGNWSFIVALLCLYLPIIWFVTDRIIEPRLGEWLPGPEHAKDYEQNADGDSPASTAELSDAQQKGLRAAGLAMLAVVLAWAFMTFGPGTPLLLDGPGTEDMAWCQKANPFFRSLVAGFMILFLAAGWA